MTKRKDSTLERIEGQPYVGIPISVLNSVAFMAASHTARSLLFEVMRQHNGRNNGHMHITLSWLKRRGWNSSDTITEAKKELIQRGLIVQTQQGGRTKPSLFALTWLPIMNFVGLDMLPRDYRRGAYALMDGMTIEASRDATRKKTKPPRGAGSSAKRIAPTPADGVRDHSATPAGGSIWGEIGECGAPAGGDNVSVAIAGASAVNSFSRDVAVQ